MRLREAMAIANEKFGVPMLLEPEDFKNPAKMDELAVIVYLTVMATILHAKVCSAREMRCYVVSLEHSDLQDLLAKVWCKLTRLPRT